MRPRLTRRSLLLGALPASLALIACQKAELLNGPVAQIAVPKQITLVAPVPSKQAADRLSGRTLDFTNQNPSIAIDLRPINGMPNGPFDIDRWVDLIQTLASGNYFDIAVSWDVWAPDMIDRGVVRPLDPYLADI